MNQTIYKYELKIIDDQTVSIPYNSQILCVQTQNNKPHLWVLVNDSTQMEVKQIEIYGTGHPIDGRGDRVYIGTFQVDSGNLVFHVFEYLGNVLNQ